MSKQNLSIGDKIGHLRPMKTRRGRYYHQYEWSKVGHIENGVAHMIGTIKQGRRTWENPFSQSVADLERWAQTPCPDANDGRTLIKIKAQQAQR